MNVSQNGRWLCGVCHAPLEIDNDSRPDQGIEPAEAAERSSLLRQAKALGITNTESTTTDALGREVWLTRLDKLGVSEAWHPIQSRKKRPILYYSAIQSLADAEFEKWKIDDSRADRRVRQVSSKLYLEAGGPRVDLPKRTRYMVLERDNFTCSYCGSSPRRDLNVKLHVDHILAVSQGGKNTMSNLVTACEACNLSKGKSKLVTQTHRDFVEQVRKRTRDYLTQLRQSKHH